MPINAADHNRLRRHWMKVVPGLINTASQILEKTMSGSELRENYPYWPTHLVEPFGNKIDKYRQTAQEMCRVGEAFLASRRMGPNWKSSECLFMNRLGVLWDTIRDDKDIMQTMEEIEAKIRCENEEARPVAMDLIARARGSKPSIS